MSTPGRPAPSPTNVDAPSAATDVHIEARKRYDAFIAKARVLIGIPDNDTSFGRHVIKPSQMAEVMNQTLITQISILEMTRGPIYGEDGTPMALSVDADGLVITEEEFIQEAIALKAEGDAKFAELQSEVTACNVFMRELAAKHGLTSTDLYAEINRRAGF